jgi:hypothetical protein
MEVREARELERDLQREAKGIYFVHYNKKGPNHKTLNSTTIQRIKKSLAYRDARYERLRPKFANTKGWIEDIYVPDGEEKNSSYLTNLNLNCEEKGEFRLNVQNPMVSDCSENEKVQGSAEKRTS